METKEKKHRKSKPCAQGLENEVGYIFLYNDTVILMMKKGGRGEGKGMKGRGEGKGRGRREGGEGKGKKGRGRREGGKGKGGEGKEGEGKEEKGRREKGREKTERGNNTFLRVNIRISMQLAVFRVKPIFSWF